MRLSLALAAAAIITAAAPPCGAQSAGDATKGAAVFEEWCSYCHLPAGGGQGPSLAGVVGRKAASLAGFNYSQALGSSGLTWTPANLDRFLAGPAKLVPGTAMQVALPDAAKRADLIAYLATLAPAR